MAISGQPFNYTPAPSQTWEEPKDSKMKQYIIDPSGRVQKNPDYKPKLGPVPSAPPPPYNPDIMRPLTTVSSIEDQIAISEVTQLGAPAQFQATLNTIQSQPYVDAFGAKDVDGGTLVDGLSDVFQRNEIPIGLMSKLTEFKGAKIHFKIDDSGSMMSNSNLLVSDFCDYMKRKVGYTRELYASRWQEAEDRLHRIIEIFAYVPTGPITLSFFDRIYQGNRITLDHKGISPEAFIIQAHDAINNFFNTTPGGGTPIYANMKNMIAEANRTRGGSDCKTMHYLLSDGEPNGGADEIRRIKNLLQSPDRNATLNPFTFLGCSNQRLDYAWMHEMEEAAPFTAALPDYKDEQMEVSKDQGRAFPYSKGMWLLCNVAAAINPNDLDALDQHWPFSKMTLENLLGRGLMVPEYLSYFNSHPNAVRVFDPDYDSFLNFPDASAIPSVRLFQNTLKTQLSRDMDNGDDDSEDRDVAIAERAVIRSRQQFRQPSLPQYGNGYGRMWNTSATRSDDRYQVSQPSQDTSSCCTIL